MIDNFKQFDANCQYFDANCQYLVTPLPQLLEQLLEAVGVPKKNGRYILIPLHGKVPVKGFPLQELYDGIDVEVKYEPTITSLGIPTGLHNLVVVDFDEDTIYERFKKEYPEYTHTFTVKTRRGHHLYYLTDGFVAGKVIKLNKIDVKCGRSYVVAPLSVVDGYKYTVEKQLPIQKITTKSYERLLKALQSLVSEGSEEPEPEKPEPEKQEKETKTCEIYDYYSYDYGSYKLEPAEEDLVEKVIDVVLPHYVEGQRQDLVFALCGFLLKHHIRPAVIKKLIEELHRRGNDTDSLNQRLSALKYSCSKPVHELVGASKLRLILKQDFEKFREIFSEIKIRFDNYIFTADLKNLVWYCIDTEAGKPRRKLVSQYFTMLALCKVGEGQDCYYEYLIQTEHPADKIIFTANKSLESFKGKLTIFSEKYFKILLTALELQKVPIRKYTQLGWEGYGDEEDRFLHPALIEDGIFELPKVFKLRDFLPSEDTKKAHHELLYKVLKEGKLLGVKVVFALSSLFTSFTVVDVAPKGTGKTFTSKLACQLFNRYRSVLNTYGTETGVELLLTRMRGLPVLLDEGALTTDERTQRMIYMLSSGWGKIRGTKKLDVSVKKIDGVVFLTNETDFNFDRKGVERRIIKIKATDRSDYTEYFISNEEANLFGAGIDYVKFYLENRNTVEEGARIFSDIIGFANDIQVGIGKALRLLQLYYGDNFENLQQTIRKVLEEQVAEANKDIFESFWEDFTSFVNVNKDNFSGDGKTVYGKIYEYNNGVVKIFVISTVLDAFCKERNYPKHIILKKAKDKGILEVSDDKRFVKKVRLGLSKVPTYVYVFTFQTETEDEKPTETNTATTTTEPKTEPKPPTAPEPPPPPLPKSGESDGGGDDDDFWKYLINSF